MINIYDSKETNFTHKGLGVLSPSSAIIYEVLNGEYSLTLIHPIDRHNKWSLLEEDRIIKANGQLFRIYKVKKSVENKEIEVYALHIFYDLSKNFIEDTNIVSKSGAQALRHILDNLSFDTNFTCDSDITTVESARLIRKNVTQSLIGDDENSFVNRWGGEIKRDNFHFDFNVQIGGSKGTKISYGKNLIGLTATIDMSNVATRIVPVAFDGITLPEMYVDSEYINNYSNPIIRVVEFENVKYADSPNNSSGEGYATLDEVYNELRRLSNLMFSDSHIDIPTSNFEVDFVELSKTEQYKKYKDLETVNLGDVVKVEHKPLNIDFTVRVISYRYNCLLNRYDSIELGQPSDTIFTSINEINKNESLTLGTIIDLVNVSKEEAVNKATELIQNGLGGYVIKTNDELIIADNPDLNLAVNVWRWNVNGLGFSSTGYNGTYGLALTNDGQIVADVITSGELNGEIIKANTIKTNALEVEAVRKIELAQSEEQVKTLITTQLGEFEVTVSDKITTELENYYTKDETVSQITQNAESIALSVSETKIKNMKLGGVNLLLDSDVNKQLDRPETSWNSISYDLVDNYKNLTLENDTTFVLSFTVDRNGNFDKECFDSITFDDGWHQRWFRDDIDKITYIKGSTYKFVMKPKTLPKGTPIADKLTFIAEFEYGGGAFYNVMLVEGDKAFDWSPSNQDIQNKIAKVDIKTDSITSEVSKIEKSMAIDNLLANGNFTNGLNNWEYKDNGVPVDYTLATNSTLTMAGKSALLLQKSNYPTGSNSGLTQTLNVKSNTNYTFTGYIASRRAEGMVIIKDENYKWLLSDKTIADDSYTGGDDISKWKRIRLVINSGERTLLRFHLAMGESGENGRVMFHDFMVTEGDTDLCWKPSERETRTQLNQLTDRITSEVVKIEKSMAIDNLLANGTFTNGLNNWEYRDHGRPVKYNLTANTYWTMVGKTALLLMQTSHPQGYDSGFTQTVAVKRNVNYTFTGYIASHRAEGMAIIKDADGGWLAHDKTNPDYDEYPGTDDISKWKRIRLVINSGERDVLQFHLAMGTSRDNGHVWFHDFMVTEGETDLCWKPSERETRTQINQLSDRITSTVSSIQTVNGKVNQANSRIDQLSDRITANVSSIEMVNGKVNQANSDIGILSNKITANVSSIEKVNGKVNTANSQIDILANRISSKVSTGDFSSLVQQNSSSVYAAISNGRGTNGVGIDTSGLYCFNNNLVTARLTEGKFHAYSSDDGRHVGYFGTDGNDLRACLYGTNTFSIFSGNDTIMLRAKYERDASYGNATLDMCGGINFIHKPGQSTGINQILLGNDDRSDAYGYHNMSIRCHNSLGFQDNNSLTNMFFDVRKGRIIMKGGLYQNAQTPPSTFALSNDEEDKFYSGITTEQMVNSILNLDVSTKVDSDGDITMMILPNGDDLTMTVIDEQPHIDIASIVAGLVETVKTLNNRITVLEDELNKIKGGE